ncbi:MAG: glycoside hydrolase domain-containing protein, partial [Planctomycetota bacterium]
MKGRMMRRWRPVAWAGAVLALLACAAYGDADQKVFSASFDGTVTPEVAGGGGKPEARGEVSYVEGAMGKALLVGERHASVSFPTPGNVRGEEGTVALWIKAIDWEPAEPKFHVFLRATTGGWVQLYTHQGGSLMMLAGKDSSTWKAASAPTEKLEKGRWHHIAGTWSKREVVLYLDGKRVGAVNTDESASPAGLSGRFEIGDFAWGPGREKAKTTAVDELSIYGRALSPEEVQNLYQRMANMLTQEVGAGQAREEKPQDEKPQAPVSDSDALREAKNAALFQQMFFRATYDDSADADVFRGDPKARVEGKVSFEEGVYGKAIVVGEDGARLTYTVASHAYPPNLSCLGGSVSFHFKAVDWEPTEKRSHLFFQVKSGALLRIFTDADGMLAFEIGTDVGQKRGVRASLEGCRRGEWIYAGATWSQEEIRLYLNGKLAARAENEERFLSYAVNTTFEVGDTPRGMGREGTRKTLIDDLTIFERALAEDELARVEAPGSGAKAPEYQPPVATAALTDAPPVMDGTWSAEEWRNAAQLTNFASVSDHKLAAIQTRAYVTYDAERIYFAVLSPVLPGAALTAQRKERDDGVWQDDAIQVYLTPPSGNTFTFIGNSIGTIYDRKYEKGIQYDVAWNGAWDYATGVEGEWWTAEVSIAFRELGTGTPSDGETWQLNVTRDRVQPQDLSAWPALSAYADSERHGRLVFSRSAPVVSEAPAFERIVGRKADLRAKISGGRTAEGANLKVAWIAALGGRIILSRSEEIALASGEEAEVRVEDELSNEPDLVAFTVTDKETGQTLYKSLASVGRREAVSVSFTPVPSQGICKVSVVLGYGAAANPRATIKLMRTGSSDGGTPVVRIERLEGSRGSGEFKLEEIEAGRYEVLTEIESYGTVAEWRTGEFVKPEEPWRGTRLGLSETPPPPWTPLTVEAGEDGALTARIWGREYVFRDGGLPERIVNDGSEMLLAGGAKIEARVGGTDEQWQPGRMRVVTQDKNAVTFETAETSQNFTLRAKTTVEFDGMLWTEMELVPKAAAQVEAVDLVVPLRSELVRYRHWPGDLALTGNIGRENGWRWMSELPKYAYFWLGNDDMGLTWFFETWGQFKHADAKATVELAREKKALTLRIRYVGEPAKIAEPLRLSFGLQATPTRPRPKGWRSWGGGNTVGTNISVPWTSEEDHRYGAGYPEAANEDYYYRLVKAQRENGWKVVPYNVLLWSANFSPEMQYNLVDWDLGGGINKYSDTRKFWWGRRICGGAASYGEFFTWKARRYIESTGIDGLYHDLQWSYKCGNPDHGYGETHRAIRGDRELNKRVYTMMKQFGRPLWKFDHAS